MVPIGLRAVAATRQSDFPNFDLRYREAAVWRLFHFLFWNAVQRPHDCDPREHRRTASRHQQQRLHCDLPIRQVGFLSRQAGDVLGGVTKRNELLAVGQRYRIFEFALPAALTGHAAQDERSRLECRLPATPRQRIRTNVADARKELLWDVEHPATTTAHFQRRGG